MVKISLNSATRKCVADSSFLGFEGENQANRLVFSFTDGFIEGTAVLNIKRGKDIGFVAVDRMKQTYELPVKSSLLTQIGDVEFQFVLTKSDGTIIKFDSFIMTVEDAIDTDAPLPEEYPSWVEMANTKLSEVDLALENTIKATANANQVANDLIFAKQNGDFDGKDGVDGTNGVSPTFQTIQVEGGARITITDAEGIKEVFLKDGPQGATGPQGEAGPRGERGATGLTGPQGPKGEVGATGLQGLRGPQGPAGPQGERGADGTVAFDELTEAQKASLKGETGAQGPAGPRGETGAQGPQGRPGASGTDGYSPTAIVEQTSTGAKITITDKNGTTTATVNHGKNGEGGGGGGITSETDPLYTADKPNLALKSEIPTKVSQLTNDSKYLTSIPSEYVTESELNGKGYLTSYTETDPTVPSWAKATTKPSYTKSEVGLGNVENVKQYSASNPPPYPVTSVNGKTGAVTVTVPTKTSELTNDSGFTTTTDLEAYKEEIVNEVLAEVGQGSSFGYIDENNNVVITQDLPVGEYTVRYETSDGSIELCTFEIKSTTKHAITNNLTGCSSNNPITEILEGESYTATISPNSGYKMSSLKVTMGGTDITSSAVSNNKITISNVTGAIVITASATEIPPEVQTFNVTFNGTNCTSNGASTATENSSYTATITANSGYEIESITVTMGGATQSGVVSGNKVTIPNVSGAIVITAVAKSGVVNILTSAGYDVKLNQRWSHTSGGFTSCNGMIALVVPIADCLNKTIYFKGFPKDIKASDKAPIWMSLKDNTRKALLVGSDTTGNVWKATNLITVDATKGIYGITINTSNFTGVSASAVDGIAINMAYKASGSVGTTVPSDAIMTIGNSNI